MSGQEALDAEVERSFRALRQTTGRLYDDPDPGWREAAACRGGNPDWWFGSYSKGVKARAEVERGREVCRSCPVQSECLRYAIVNFIDFGIYGGLDEGERAAMAAGLDLVPPEKPIEHGRESTYTRGCRCVPCTVAATFTKASRP